MYPKNRLEALTDGIFAVAMTILVLDLRIPDDSAVGANDASFYQALLALSPKFLPYLLSFYVLGVNWLSLIKARSRGFTSHPAATVIYAASIGVMALTAFLLMSLLPDPVKDRHWTDRWVSLLVLLASCVITMALSFVIPGSAL
jgi:uncharacterized membrane protein